MTLENIDELLELLNRIETHYAGLTTERMPVSLVNYHRHLETCETGALLHHLP